MPAALALVTLTATFRDSAGTELDPDIITAVVTSPDGFETAYAYSASITRSDTGIFTFTASCDVPGRWKVKWYGETSTLKREQTAVFDVS